MKLLVAALPLLCACNVDDEGHSPATSQQILTALSECHVLTRDFARDRALGGDYVVMIHGSEPARQGKLTCVGDRLRAQYSYAAIVSPEPTNREGLYQ